MSKGDRSEPESESETQVEQQNYTQYFLSIKA